MDNETLNNSFEVCYFTCSLGQCIYKYGIFFLIRMSIPTSLDTYFLTIKINWRYSGADCSTSKEFLFMLCVLNCEINYFLFYMAVIVHTKG